jgi:hypothetical protein
MRKVGKTLFKKEWVDRGEQSNPRQLDKDKPANPANPTAVNTSE